MSKWHIVYNKELTTTPISFWVHANVDSDTWHDASSYDPPFPKRIPMKGFPLLVVENKGYLLEFASVFEAEHFLEVIGQKNMPSTNELSRIRSDDYGPIRHWLSRLPSKLKPWTKRKKLISVVEAALQEYRKVCQ